MKFVPTIPPVTTVTKDELEVEALAAVKAVKPVQPRTLPPLVVRRHAQHEALPDTAEQSESHHDVRVHGERRTYCRRIEHLPELVELRSGLERRRHNQRDDDMTEHVDEKV